MEVGVRVITVNYRTSETKHILSAYFTFVAVDDDHKPTAVSAVIPETPVQKRRFEEADFRRTQRRREAEERRLRRLKDGA
jgi:acyl-CoA hydrolase